MITVSKLENLNEEVIAEINALHDASWLEIRGRERPAGSSGVDWEAYQRGMDAGCVHAYVVMSNFRIIGYSFWLVSKSLHTGFLMAQQTLVYVDKNYRGMGVGKILHNFCERSLEGVDEFQVTSCTNCPTDDRWIGLGYKLVERVYRKEMDNGLVV